MPATRRKRSTRAKSPKSTEVVAPGGGTQSDVSKLASNLGLSSNAVTEILNCEGGGIAPAKRKSSRGEEAGAASGSANGNGGATSSAWADFMTEEGIDGDDNNKKEDASKSSEDKSKSSQGEGATKTANDASSSNSDSNPNKRAKTQQDDYDNNNSTTTSASPEDSDPFAKRNYKLPIQPHLPTPGILAQTGTLDSAIVGRTKRSLTNNFDLQEPTFLTYESILDKSKIKVIAASSTSAHSIAITTDGKVYTWGRNENGQCGLGYTSPCVPLPTQIQLEGQFIAAAVGKTHSVLVQDNGDVHAVGGNKYGQCGVNTSIEAILKWKKCVIQKHDDAAVKIVQASCGESFTMLLSSAGILYSAGLSEFGQLGNGETGEYFVTASKIAFANATSFQRRSDFVSAPADINFSYEDSKKNTNIPLPDASDIRIGSIACGKNHTVAVEAHCTNQNSAQSVRVFTWGCGGYGVLGHAIQADEYKPRLIGTLQGPLFQNNKPIRASAGAHCSMVLTENGHVYYSGKHRSVGEATMRPTLIDVLANNMHVVKALGGGAQSVFCATENGVTVSWGMGLSGELGYGATSAKSSSKPKFVEKLDACIVTDVACGYGHTLFIISDEDEEDRKAYKKMAKIEAGDVEAFVKKHAQ